MPGALAGTSVEKENSAIPLAQISEIFFGVLFIYGLIATTGNYFGSKE